MKNEIEILTKELLKYNFEYYNNNESSITDKEYDEKLVYLKELENKYPEYKLINTPTSNVGGFVSSEFVTKKHKYRLYSLQDIFSFDELYKFFNDMKKVVKEPVYSVELKIDGIAMVLTYNNGLLQRAVTRGDAYQGEDVTENIKTIKSIPQSINYDEELEIRGEVYMPLKSFNSYNEEIMNRKCKIPEFINGLIDNYQLNMDKVESNYDDEVIKEVFIDIECEINLLSSGKIKDAKKDLLKIKKLYKEKLLSNPRNSASGSVRNLDTSITKRRKLSFLPYGTNIDGYNDIDSNNSHFDTITHFVDNFGFIRPRFIKTSSEEEVINFITNIEKERGDLDFDIDGIVIKIDNVFIHEQIGYTAKFPKWAVAYKYKPIPSKTKLIEIRYQVGKTGAITPVAIVKPVNVSGSMISRVTLHNKDYIKQNSLKINDIVTIHKSGDVIPQIINNEHTNESIDIEFIKHCPSCDSTLDFSEIKTFCRNDDCPSRIVQKLTHFVSRNNMNIESVSEKNIELFVNHSSVRDVSDLYNLTFDKIMCLPRMGEKSAYKILDEIEKSKSKDLANLLSGLSIKNIGTKNASYLAKVYEDIDKLVESFNMNEEIINYFDDFSQILINSIKTFINNNLNIINKLKYFGVNTKSYNYNNYYEENNKLLNLNRYLMKMYVDNENVLSRRKNKFSSFDLVNVNEINIEELSFEKMDFSKKLFKEFNMVLEISRNDNVINDEYYDKLINITSKNKDEANFWEDKKVVVTGSFDNYKRNEIEKIITDLGATATKSISSKTDYLLYGDKAGSKLDKAVKLNVKTISQSEFYNIIGENNG